MSMATLQLYKNPYPYPNYGSISRYGAGMPCTPIGTGLKTGSIKVKGNMSDFMSCNYLSIRRDGQTIYAWIEDVRHSTANSFEIDYSVDAWRTYRNNVQLGTQFVERSGQVTDKYDDLLTGTSDTPVIDVRKFEYTSHTRVLVVQVRIVDGARFGYSSTPVQPTPYAFYVTRYNPSNWQMTNAITSLLSVLSEVGETNLVTMYSIPWMRLTGLPDIDLPVVWGDSEDQRTYIEGWKLIPNTDDVHEHLTRRIAIPTGWIDNPETYRVDHSVQVVVPDAGIIDIPDQLLKKGSIYLRQDIDLFSGASNYMVEDSDGNQFTNSVRGASVSSIPILSDAMDTYLSQNQNALTTSLIGDVATTTVGLGLTYASPGVGMLAGLPTAMGGINSIVSRASSIRDRKNMNNVGNPPAFLGTALAGPFNSTFWIVLTKDNVDNEEHVHSNYGYPIRRVQPLVFPSSGYIKTQGCSVSSDGTVPRWAIEEINRLFDSGIYVH